MIMESEIIEQEICLMNFDDNLQAASQKSFGKRNDFILLTEHRLFMDAKKNPENILRNKPTKRVSRVDSLCDHMEKDLKIQRFWTWIYAEGEDNCFLTALLTTQQFVLLTKH